jgi:hypothetical protein
MSSNSPSGQTRAKDPTNRILISLNAALVCRVAKGPSEPKDKLAREYNVDVDTIRQVVR